MGGTLGTEDLITRREAAEIAGVHINTVRLWEQSGRVSAQKAPNGVVLIPRDEIERIAAERHDSAMGDRERVAALEADNRRLQEELDRLRGQYQQLLDKVISLVRSD